MWPLFAYTKANLFFDFSPARLLQTIIFARKNLKSRIRPPIVGKWGLFCACVAPYTLIHNAKTNWRVFVWGANCVSKAPLKNDVFGIRSHKNAVASFAVNKK